MTDNSQQKKPDLAKFLVDEGVISGAQMQLAIADQEVTGMPLDEVLIARGWISQSRLEQIAPWLKKQTVEDNTIKFEPGARTYDASLKEYRRLMEKILGTSWDY